MSSYYLYQHRVTRLSKPEIVKVHDKPVDRVATGVGLVDCVACFLGNSFMDIFYGMLRVMGCLRERLVGTRTETSSESYELRLPPRF
jgi:hypothetical protein